MKMDPSSLRLAIDVREACAEKPTGKGMWTRRFAEELLRRDRPMLLLTDRPVPSDWKTIADAHPDRVTVRQIPLPGLRWHVRAAAVARAEAGACVSPTSYIVPCLLGKRLPVFPIVHDLIAFRDEPHDRRATFIERLTLKRALRHARGILVISESTKADLLARYPRIAPDLVAPIFAGPSWSGTVRTSSPAGPAVVSIGTLCPRKNQLRLIKAFASLPSPLRERASLTLVGGRGWGDAPIIAAAGETPGVVWRDYLPDAECEELLSRASVFAFPSLYEGFGLPVLDAFARGIPVLTSDRGSLREVASGAALACDPESVESIARALERLLTDDALRAELSEKGLARAAEFSWKRTADLFEAAIERFLAI